ncbi:hypothetical protein CQ395_03670 [Clostridium neonatale]|uniref:Uncharacterized protein n=1 Tax=Clostridium neonatale TaxID=137838 RepID=A0A2A7MHU0_9CLOT|nr:hypothetical protein [Clostridium neonatale]PEG28189.1 hypothetical protein CQ395_03670 [Clostridium neonatale]PEG30678.1 hypothetical protein CQ394_02845 [Clostridium neonatale]CAH0436622.1 Conserved hypothetical protein [Clostridium neonatale]CAI3245126.1 Conserved hypothetical protein [Clostridium neonatale]CAI3573010.1 Conserved hypothetical protein [Clostridium neonatale]
MKNKKIEEINLKKFNIKGLDYESRQNILGDFVKNNINQLEILNKEIHTLLENDWIYIKNKKVYYNSNLNALFPDLLTFIIGFCPIREEFNDDSLRLEFGGFHGRIMTDIELLSILDKSGNVQGISFYNYTVFVNGIRYIDKNNISNINKFKNNNNPYLSYHIPIYELDDNTSIIDENGYDLKYIDNRNYINDVLDIVNLWYKFDLIPDGLSKESEDLYIKMMELSKIGISKYLISHKRI